MRRIALSNNNATPTLLHHYLTEFNVNWDFVQNYLTESPEQARSPNQYGATPLYKALYRRTADYPSFEVVKQLLDAYPPAMWGTDPAQCPLKVACWRRASVPILELLLNSRPSRPSTDMQALDALWKSYQNVHGGNLKAFILEGGEEAMEIWTKFRMMLKFCTCQTMESYQCLHTTATTATPTLLADLELSLSLFPEQIQQPDHQGKLPLHCAVGSSLPALNNDDDSPLTATTQSTAVQAGSTMLLRSYPEAATIRDNESLRLPLHTAIATDKPWEVIQNLESPQVDGVTHLYPFQLAASCDSSLSVVYSLLRAAPHLVQDGIVSNEEQHGTKRKLVTTSLATLQMDSAAARLGQFDKDALRQANEDKLAQWASSESVWSDARRILERRFDATTTDWFTVHAAASLIDCPLGLLELAVTLHAQELTQRNADGSVPLHVLINALTKRSLAEGHFDSDYAESLASSEQEQMLVARMNTVLHSCPDAAQIPDGQGKLPLHMAVHAGHPWASLDALIHAYPAGIFQRDDRGLYPYQIAAAAEEDECRLTELYQLLQAAPHLISTSNVD